MIRVSDFLNTIGVNTRLAYTDGDYRSAANVLSALNWLGIDHVRDFGVWNKWVGQSSYGLLADAGIKFDMVLQTNRSPRRFHPAGRGVRPEPSGSGVRDRGTE
jgi:hypothetical protein